MSDNKDNKEGQKVVHTKQQQEVIRALEQQVRDEYAAIPQVTKDQIAKIKASRGHNDDGTPVDTPEWMVAELARLKQQVLQVKASGAASCEQPDQDGSGAVAGERGSDKHETRPSLIEEMLSLARRTGSPR